MLEEDVRDRMDQTNKICTTKFRENSVILRERIDNWHDVVSKSCHNLSECFKNLERNTKQSLLDLADEINKLRMEFATVNGQCNRLEQTYNQWFTIKKVLASDHHSSSSKNCTTVNASLTLPAAETISSAQWRLPGAGSGSQADLLSSESVAQGPKHSTRRKK